MFNESFSIEPTHDPRVIYHVRRYFQDKILPRLADWETHISEDVYHIGAILKSTEPHPTEDTLQSIEPLLRKLCNRYQTMQRFSAPENLEPHLKRHPLGLQIALKLKLNELTDDESLSLALVENEKFRLNPFFIIENKPAFVVLLENGFIKTAAYFVEQDVNPNFLYTYNNKTESLLFHFLESGNLTALTALIQVGANVNCLVKQGGMLIHHAVQLCLQHKNEKKYENYLACLKALLAAGADPSPHWRNANCSATPLHYVVLADHLELLTLLCAYGADTNIVASERINNFDALTSDHPQALKKPHELAQSSIVGDFLQQYQQSIASNSDRITAANRSMVFAGLAHRPELEPTKGENPFAFYICESNAPLSKTPVPVARSTTKTGRLTDITLPNPVTKQSSSLAERIFEAMKRRDTFVRREELFTTKISIQGLTPILPGTLNTDDVYAIEAATAQFVPVYHHSTKDGLYSQRVVHAFIFDRHTGEMRKDAVLLHGPKGEFACYGTGSSHLSQASKRAYSATEVFNPVRAALEKDPAQAKQLEQQGLIVVFVHLKDVTPPETQSDSPMIMKITSAHAGTGISTHARTDTGAEVSTNDLSITELNGEYAIADIRVGIVTPLVLNLGNEKWPEHTSQQEFSEICQEKARGIAEARAVMGIDSIDVADMSKHAVSLDHIYAQLNRRYAEHDIHFEKSSIFSDLLLPLLGVKKPGSVRPYEHNVYEFFSGRYITQTQAEYLDLRIPDLSLNEKEKLVQQFVAKYGPGSALIIEKNRILLSSYVLLHKVINDWMLVYEAFRREHPLEYKNYRWRSGSTDAINISHKIDRYRSISEKIGVLSFDRGFNFATDAVLMALGFTELASKHSFDIGEIHSSANSALVWVLYKNSGHIIISQDKWQEIVDAINAQVPNAATLHPGGVIITREAFVGPIADFVEQYAIAHAFEIKATHYKKTKFYYYEQPEEAHKKLAEVRSFLESFSSLDIPEELRLPCQKLIEFVGELQKSKPNRPMVSLEDAQDFYCTWQAFLVAKHKLIYSEEGIYRSRDSIALKLQITKLQALVATIKEILNDCHTRPITRLGERTYIHLENVDVLLAVMHEFNIPAKADSYHFQNCFFRSLGIDSDSIAWLRENPVTFSTKFYSSYIIFPKDIEAELFTKALLPYGKFEPYGEPNKYRFNSRLAFDDLALKLREYLSQNPEAVLEAQKEASARELFPFKNKIYYVEQAAQSASKIPEASALSAALNELANNTNLDDPTKALTAAQNIYSVWHQFKRDHVREPEKIAELKPKMHKLKQNFLKPSGLSF